MNQAINRRKKLEPAKQEDLFIQVAQAFMNQKLKITKQTLSYCTNVNNLRAKIDQKNTRCQSMLSSVQGDDRKKPQERVQLLIHLNNSSRQALTAQIDSSKINLVGEILCCGLITILLSQGHAIFVSFVVFVLIVQWFLLRQKNTFMGFVFLRTGTVKNRTNLWLKVGCND